MQIVKTKIEESFVVVDDNKKPIIYFSVVNGKDITVWTNQHRADFKFIDSQPETVRLIGIALISIANVAQGLPLDTDTGKEEKR